jgi:hypothetical protein
MDVLHKDITSETIGTTSSQSFSTSTTPSSTKGGGGKKTGVSKKQQQQQQQVLDSTTKTEEPQSWEDPLKDQIEALKEAASKVPKHVLQKITDDAEVKKKLRDALTKRLAAFVASMTGETVSSSEKIKSQKSVSSNSDEDVENNNTLPPSTRDLQLRVGAQVMLTYNIDVDKGLVNGSRGVVEGFRALVPSSNSSSTSSTSSSSFSSLHLAPPSCTYEQFLAVSPRSSSQVTSQVTNSTQTKTLVFSCGSGECEQLGHGNDCYSLEMPQLLRSLVRVPIARIAVGGIHSIALTTTGEVWS